jgi:acyl dehydratase
MVTGYPTVAPRAIDLLASGVLLCDDRVMQSQSPRYWEDYQVGAKYPLGSTTFTTDEIVAFARQFDPQSFHLDAEAAKRSMFGGLIASGWHIASTLMRLFVDNYLDSRTALGSPGVDEIRWLKPVRPGDTLSSWVVCTDKVPSKSRPEMGIIHEHWHATNQKGELVLTLKGISMVRRRPG